MSEYVFFLTIKRAISNLFVKIKDVDTKVADLQLKLKNDFGFSRNWVQRMENWVLTSLAKSITEVKKRLLKKLKILRENKSKELQN